MEILKKVKRSKILWVLGTILISMVVYYFLSYVNYAPRHIIGKHYEEIIANYGEFDSGNAEFVGEEEKYKYSKYCGYTKKYFYEINNAGTYEIFSITDAVINPYNNRVYPHIIIEFDDDGYAISITKGYLFPPGG